MSHSTADAYPGVAGVVAAASAFVRFRPGLCYLRVVGRSREGRPLHLLTVGRDRPRVRNVLVVAGPHSDERVGAASALRIAERVALDPHLHVGSGAAWHFLLCLDPDGTLRSEGGPAVRRTPAEHFGHAYRPPADEQPEWAPSFGLPEDQLPESQALIGVIDELHPVLQCSLHGNDIGGSWVQLTRDLPGLAERLGKLCAERDVPVQTGTYDALYWPSSGPGVYLMPGPGERVQFDSLPEDVSRSTWSRPHVHGGMTALFEVPMWASPGIADPGAHPDPARALAGLATLLRQQSEQVRSLLAEVRQTVPHLGGDDHRARLLRIAEGLAEMGPRVAQEWEGLHPSPVRLSRAHVRALDIAARRMGLRAAGTLLQLLAAAGSPPGARLRAAGERRLGLWAAELAAAHDLTWVSVPTQVDLQTEAVLAAFRLMPA